MKIAVGTLLSFSLLILTSQLVAAEENSCVESFRQANKDFVKQSGKLRTEKYTGLAGTAAGTVAAVGCGSAHVLNKTGLAKVPALNAAGTVACVGGSAVIALGSGAYWAAKANEEDSLFDTHRLMEAYNAIDRNVAVGSVFVKELLEAATIGEGQEELALKEYKTLMLSNSLCEGSRRLSFDEATELLRARVANTKPQ